MGKRCRLELEWCFHKLFFGVEGSSIPEGPATQRRWRFHPEPPMTLFSLYEYRPIPSLSRHHVEPISEYSNVGSSHHPIDRHWRTIHLPSLRSEGQYPLVLKTTYCQGPSSNLLRPLAQRVVELYEKQQDVKVGIFLLLGNHVKPNSDEQFGEKRWFHNVFFTNDEDGSFVFSGFYGTD